MSEPTSVRERWRRYAYQATLSGVLPFTLGTAEGLGIGYAYGHVGLGILAGAAIGLAAGATARAYACAYAIEMDAR